MMQTVNSLSVRSKWAHRNVADPVRITGSLTDLTSSRILLLIHGFANSEDRAHTSYERFQTALDAVPDVTSGLWGTVWEFHWPGDYPGSKLKSFATYPARVPVAQSSAEFLARFLHENPYLRRHQDVIIVAHSLGCRV